MIPVFHQPSSYTWFSQWQPKTGVALKNVNCVRESCRSYCPWMRSLMLTLESCRTKYQALGIWMCLRYVAFYVLILALIAFLVLSNTFNCVLYRAVWMTLASFLFPGYTMYCQTVFKSSEVSNTYFCLLKIEPFNGDSIASLVLSYSSTDLKYFW